MEFSLYETLQYIQCLRQVVELYYSIWHCWKFYVHSPPTWRWPDNWPIFVAWQIRILTRQGQNQIPTQTTMTSELKLGFFRSLSASCTIKPFQISWKHANRSLDAVFSQRLWFHGHALKHSRKYQEPCGWMVLFTTVPQIQFVSSRWSACCRRVEWLPLAKSFKPCSKPFVPAAANVTWIIPRSGRSYRTQRLQFKLQANDFGQISEDRAKWPTKKGISWLKPGFGKDDVMHRCCTSRGHLPIQASR